MLTPVHFQAVCALNVPRAARSQWPSQLCLESCTINQCLELGVSREPKGRNVPVIFAGSASASTWFPQGPRRTLLSSKHWNPHACFFLCLMGSYIATPSNCHRQVIATGNSALCAGSRDFRIQQLKWPLRESFVSDSELVWVRLVFSCREPSSNLV